MPFVYLLHCSDHSLYCGYALDLQKRLKDHSARKGAKYTRGRLPVKLLYVEEFVSKSAALKREFQIKQLSREQKIALIKKS